MKRIKKIGKKGGLFLVAISMLCVGVPVSASTEPSIESPSNVWVDVISPDLDAQISVTLPLAYGFVVEGTINSQSNVGITNETLLLPNYSVQVNDHKKDGYGSFALQTQGSGEAFEVRNYSTCVNTSVKENPHLDTSIRLGLPLKLSAYIENYNTDANIKAEKDVPKDRGYWNVVDKKPSKDPSNFKTYQIGFHEVWNDAERLNSNPNMFSELDVNTGRIHLKEMFSLKEPPIEGGIRPSNVSVDPSFLTMDLLVHVGGERRQYHQVEQSLKVGQVSWVIYFEDPSEP